MEEAALGGGECVRFLLFVMDLFEEVKQTQATLKRYAPAHTAQESHIARTPAFLKFESRPFEPSQFVESKKTVDELALETNSVRWKYTSDEDKSKVYKSSNARVVYWEDGSKTLQIGDEHFIVKSNELHEPVLIAITDEQKPDPEQTQTQTLNTAHVLNSQLTFLPTSTNSSAHKMLANALAQKQAQHEIRVQSVSTKEDPDKVQRELERMESQKEKARRKLDANQESNYSYTRFESSNMDAEDSDLAASEDDEAIGNKLTGIKNQKDESDESDANASDDDNDDNAGDSMEVDRTDRKFIDDSD